ncbi:NADH:flavin oxidoreductase [Mesorhizobium silamurunense]|uniref:NADH:flavin oxidoreductase n=1 Tax=Mesorhizobium silamurunense TaxID=499528 RepID=UPI00177EBE6D|nr:NADH:flavin oxidoreductase [Mesorhizobium silamurunense]
MSDAQPVAATTSGAKPAAYRALFEEFTIKNLTLKNRIMSTSHAPAYGEHGMPTERYQRYHEEKAKGGLALTMFGGASAIAPDSPPSFGQLYVGSDEIIPHFTRFSERIHRHGTALMCQLSHVGRRTHANRDGWLPALSASNLKEPAHGSFPKAMEAGDFKRVATSYADAASRCQQGGLDGCELLIAGHLIGQFWSPLVNQRTDAYGGSLENRLRFGFEVLSTIRDRVGPDFIVGIRYTADEMLEGGIGLDEGIEIARLHEKSGLVDFLNINGSNNWTNAGVASTVPGMAYPSPTYANIARDVRKAVRLPLLHATRITDFATADAIIKDGIVDMVGMTRAHIADPHLVEKYRTGREAEIRPCVGASYCIDRIYKGGDALCVHNVATGRESFIPHKIARTSGAKRKVVVVGGGPGGMEAARVAAERGHHVTLFEAADELGGQVILASQLEWRRDLIGITRWLADRLQALDVDIRYNSYAEADDVASLNPEVVIVATGGLPNMALVEGGELAVSSWEVLDRSVKPADNVLVYDDNGGHAGPVAAQYLAAAGSQVELITPDVEVGHQIGTTNAIVHRKYLYSQGVVLTPDRRVTKVERRGNAFEVTIRNEYSNLIEKRSVEQVVIECGTIPNDGIYFDLVERSVNRGMYDLTAFAAGRLQTECVNPQGEFELYRLGDAVASRDIHAAMYDAVRICKDL